MFKVLQPADVIKKLCDARFPQRRYAAMYSSWFGGLITEPNFMLIPIDDHGFHRGDAVFEAIKAVDGKLYALDRHLDRMAISAEKIGLQLPANLRDIAIETTKVSGLGSCILRCFVSRGPGGFTTNPYESVGAQTYVVVTPLTPPANIKYQTGVSAMTSAVKIKEGVFSTVKSCNYLPNVMMKKEAVDLKVDFTVSIDESGQLAEGSTENFAIISKDGAFLVPSFARTLRGVTLIRLMELASEKPELKKLIKEVKHAAIGIEDVIQAREAMFIGTTLDCLPCTKYDGHTIGSGSQGEIAAALQAALTADIANGPLAVPYQ